LKIERGHHHFERPELRAVEIGSDRLRVPGDVLDEVVDWVGPLGVVVGGHRLAQSGGPVFDSTDELIQERCGLRVADADTELRFDIRLKLH